jgi:hypothetical protein
MKLDYKMIVELIGIAGIVSSLIFVGLQIQQESEATRSATVLQLKDAWAQSNMAQATNVELNEALWEITDKGWEKSTRISRALVGSYYRTVFHNASNAYYQYRIGTLEPEIWEPHLAEIRTYPTSIPGFRPAWEEWKHLYDRPFRELVEQETR